MWSEQEYNTKAPIFRKYNMPVASSYQEYVSKTTGNPSGEVSGIMDGGLVNDQGYRTEGGQLNRWGERGSERTSMLGSTGQLDPRLQQSLGTSYSSLRDKAMGEGPSKWAQLQQQQAQTQYGQGLDTLAAQQAGALGQARSNMAMRGGLSTGAAERMAQSGARQSMMGQQALGRQLDSANLNIGLQDEQMKNQMLGTLGGVEQNIQSGNIGRMERDITGKNLASANDYGERMRLLAAEKTGQAQAAAAGGGKK